MSRLSIEEETNVGDTWGDELIARRRSAEGDEAMRLDLAIAGYWNVCLPQGHAWQRASLLRRQCERCQKAELRPFRDVFAPR